ncbi:MAG TPA: hypothetical protein ACQGQH_04525 [Xylella sp.]
MELVLLHLPLCASWSNGYEVIVQAIVRFGKALGNDATGLVFENNNITVELFFGVYYFLSGIH